MRFFITLFLAISSTFIYSQNIEGDWHGVLEISGMKLRLVFHVEKTNLVYSSNLDSPDQGAFGIEMDETNVKGNQLTIISEQLRLIYNGEYNPEKNQILGTFKQGPMEMELNLQREVIEKEIVVRPQEPTTFNYIQEEVTFENSLNGHTLAGTLTIPSDKQFDKVAILVTGSGPQNRNEELLNHKPFLVLSDYLTRNGIAVLRYDDRGVGASTGDFASATTADLAEDARSAWEYVKSRSDMSGKLIGIVGHSEGGMIAPIVAAENDIDFIVLLAGPGINSVELLLLQVESIAKVQEDANLDAIAYSDKINRKVFQHIADNAEMDPIELQKEIKDFIEEDLSFLSEKQKEEYKLTEQNIDAQLGVMTSDWFRYFLAFDPGEYLEKVTCPVLAINGTLDLQVTYRENLMGISKSLAKAGNLNYTIRALDGLNHLFQKDDTGNPNNYGRIEETFNESALEMIADWINQYNL